MSVVIRKSGYAWTWICKVHVLQPDGKTKVCNHTDVVESKEVASAEYEKHKKTTKGH